MKRNNRNWFQVVAGTALFLSVLTLQATHVATIASQNPISWACPKDMTKNPPECRRVVIWGELCSCY